MDNTTVAQKRIPINEIDTSLRARKTYEDIEELSASITKHGLIHPIAILDKSKVKDWTGIEKEDLNSKKPYLLLAGGRRFTAWRFGDHGPAIPARIYDQPLTADKMKEIELYENLHRVGLSWQEKVDLEEQIHELQVKIHGKPIRGVADAEGHKVEDTAKMLNKSKATISQDIKLSKAMKKLPELAEAKTKTEALKMLQKLDETEKSEKRAKKIEAKNASTSEDIRKKKLVDSYHHGSFFDGVQNVSDESIDLVEIDPPYGIDLYTAKRGNPINSMGYMEVEDALYLDFMFDLFSECYRVMKAHSWMICWFGPHPWFEPIYKLIRLAGKPEDMEDEEWLESKQGFRTRRIPGIWNKMHGQTQQPTMYLGNSYEMFFYVQKGAPAIKQQGRSNVFTYEPVNSHNKVHPTERPVELMQEVLKTFGDEGCQLMVPFAGSGNTILAGNNLHMEGITWDTNKKYRDDFVVRAFEGEIANYKSYGRGKEE